MIVCTQCGHSNPDGTTWCAQPGCGALLEFVGDEQHTQGHAAVEQPPAPPMPTWPSSGGSKPLPKTPISKTPSPAPQGPAPEPAPPTPTPEPSTPARQPERAGPRKAPVRPAPAPSEVPPLRPGEVACPVCGWGNEPGRYFCRHDGAVLTKTPESPGQEAPLPVGQRRRLSGALAPGNRRWLVLAGVLAALAAVIGGYFIYAAQIGGGKPKVSASPSLAPVVKALLTVRASSVSNYKKVRRKPEYVIDGDPATFWSGTDSDRRPVLKVSFRQNLTITRLEIINGASGKDFTKRPGAAQLELSFAKGKPQTLRLNDELGKPQSFDIAAPQPGLWVRLKVKSVQKRTIDRTKNGRRVSISEIRLFTQP